MEAVEVTRVTLLTAVVVSLAVVAPAAAQQSPRGPALQHDSRGSAAQGGATTPTPYPDISLGPGDGVRIVVFRQPDASGEYTVNELGTLDLPLVGEVAVTGKSIRDLRGEISEKFRVYFRDPHVLVTPLYRINILGEVRNPGLYPVDLTMTLPDVLALAGGLASNGSLAKVDVLRSGRSVRWDLSDPETRAREIGRFGFRSGDEIVVGERSKGFWESVPLAGSILAAAAGLYAVASN